ncbi:hypothetical protein J4573_17875 [Actinomadura barringtoniae]|uniref:Secreted protein n=1 Tax=Actinomadura barringtoniae TaxID=1427535 RepID=A0A939PAC6_9ACTN|nr:hypothetical protein [Actinomadura barringtoniae]MBO2448976.1 hypothetical protein [Actinomadura barringtoniae]
MKSVLAGAGVLGAALAFAPFAPASAATHADVGSIVCRGGQFNVQFDPGVTFATGTVRLTASGDLGVCQSDEHPKITGGTIRAEASLQGKCPGPVGPGYAKVSVSFNDGSRAIVNQSTFRGDGTSWSFEGGRVSSGPFTGGTARGNGRTISNLIELGAGCAVGGLKEYRASIDEALIGDI